MPDVLWEAEDKGGGSRKSSQTGFLRRHPLLFWGAVVCLVSGCVKSICALSGPHRVGSSGLIGAGSLQALADLVGIKGYWLVCGAFLIVTNMRASRMLGTGSRRWTVVIATVVLLSPYASALIHRNIQDALLTSERLPKARDIYGPMNLFNTDLVHVYRDLNDVAPYPALVAKAWPSVLAAVVPVAILGVLVAVSLRRWKAYVRFEYSDINDLLIALVPAAIAFLALLAYGIGASLACGYGRVGGDPLEHPGWSLAVFAYFLIGSSHAAFVLSFRRFGDSAEGNSGDTD